MKFKRASIITKIVVLILLIYIAITLLSVRSKIQAANAAIRRSRPKWTSRPRQTPPWPPTSPTKMTRTPSWPSPKERMGLLESGEIIFYDTTN